MAPLVTLSDTGVALVVLGVALSPLAAVAMVALLRGYTIQLNVKRPRRDRRDRDGG